MSRSTRGYPGLMLGLALVVLVAGSARGAAQGIVLEAIVKFSDTSVLGREVSRALGADPGDLSGLSAPLKELSLSIGVPLEARRITSGRELIVGVREQPLLEAVSRTCRGNPAVTSAELIAVGSENPVMPTHRLLVTLATSSDEAKLVAEASRGEAPAAEVQALAVRLSALSGVPVRGSVKSEDRLVLDLDRFALLTSLVNRLQATGSVDYVQANSLMQHQ